MDSIACCRSGRLMAKFKLENQEPEEPADVPSSGGWWGDLENLFEKAGAIAKNAPLSTPAIPLIIVGKKVEDIIAQKYFGREKPKPKVTIAENPAAAEQNQQTKDVENEIGRRNPLDMPAVSAGGFQYQLRPVYGFAPINNKPPTLDEISNKFVDIVITSPSGIRILNPNVFKPGRLGGPSYYAGDALTDEFGRLSRGQYDVSSSGFDARNELMYLNRKEGATLALLKELKRTDFYGNNDISSLALNNLGFGPADEMAMIKFLDYSNQRFQTWQAVFPTLGKFTGQTSSSGPKFRPISDADMGSYLQEYALLLTGNKLTKEQLKTLLKESLNVQKAAFSAGQDIPRPSTIAEQVVSQSSPTQAASYGLGNAIGAAFAALGASRG